MLPFNWLNIALAVFATLCFAYFAYGLANGAHAQGSNGGGNDSGGLRHQEGHEPPGYGGQSYSVGKDGTVIIGSGPGTTVPGFGKSDSFGGSEGPHGSGGAPGNGFGHGVAGTSNDGSDY